MTLAILAVACRRNNFKTMRANDDAQLNLLQQVVRALTLFPLAAALAVLTAGSQSCEGHRL